MMAVRITQLEVFSGGVSLQVVWADCRVSEK